MMSPFASSTLIKCVFEVNIEQALGTDETIAFNSWVCAENNKICF